MTFNCHRIDINIILVDQLIMRIESMVFKIINEGKDGHSASDFNAT